jgi:hypothetical protein
LGATPLPGKFKSLGCKLSPELCPLAVCCPAGAIHVET